MAAAVKPGRLKAKARRLRLNAEARAVAQWAYRNLRHNRGTPFPFTIEVRGSPEGRIVELVPKHESSMPFTVPSIREQVAQLNGMAADVVRNAEETDRLEKPTDGDELAMSLGQVVKHANALLAQLAKAGNQKAIERLAGHALGAAIELLKLSRTNLSLVKPVARQWAMWPVAYNPHSDSKTEMEALIRRLEVGRAAPENVEGAWSNEPTKGQPFRHILGIYAFRMMQNVLRKLCETTALRKRLFAAVRKDFSLLEDSAPIPMTEQEKTELVAQDWPAWIVDLVNLPPFSNDSAEAWFEVGWAALRESAGGKVASIPELKPAGHSRAEYWRRGTFSDRIQASQREGLIHGRLRDVFLSRFKITQ